MKTMPRRIDAIAFLTAYASALLAVLAGVFLLPDAYGHLPWSKALFFLLMSSLPLYVGWECWRAARTRPDYALIMPPVAASFWFFVLAFGVANVGSLVELPTHVQNSAFANEAYSWMNKVMLLAFVAAFFMWRGFNFSGARRFSTAIRRLLQDRSLIRHTLHVRPIVAIAFLAISIGARLVRVRLGIFGYNSDVERLDDLAGYTQYLTMASGLGLLVLAVAGLAYFSNKGQRPVFIALLFGTALLSEVGFGLLSGYKGETVVPIIVVGLCYYIAKGRIPSKWILVTLAALVFAYNVIEPYRAIRYDPTAVLNTRDVGSIASTMVDIVFNEGVNTGRAEAESIVEKVASRIGFVPITAHAIHFKDNALLESDDPDFLTRILYAPVYAVVPRILLPSKPKGNIGYWYNVRVMGASPYTVSSTGMSPIGYLYFAGGVAGVALGFFLIGMLQRFIFSAFYLAGGGGVLIFLGMWESVVRIDSSVDGLIILFIRMVPLLIVAQLLLLRPEPAVGRSVPTPYVARPEGVR